MSIRDRIHDSGGIFSRLLRYPDRGWIAGVCVGLAEYFDWNVKLIRIAFILGLVFSGFFPVGAVYLVLWYLMDEAGERERGSRTRAAADTAGFGPGSGMGDVRSRFARMEQRLRNMEACVSSKDFELRRELKKLES